MNVGPIKNVFLLDGNIHRIFINHLNHIWFNILSHVNHIRKPFDMGGIIRFECFDKEGRHTNIPFETFKPVRTQHTLRTGIPTCERKVPE